MSRKLPPNYQFAINWFQYLKQKQHLDIEQIQTLLFQVEQWIIEESYDKITEFFAPFEEEQREQNVLNKRLTIKPLKQEIISTATVVRDTVQNDSSSVIKVRQSKEEVTKVKRELKIVKEEVKSTSSFIRMKKTSKQQTIHDLVLQASSVFTKIIPIEIESVLDLRYQSVKD